MSAPILTNFLLKHYIQENSGCKTINFIDNTGVYHATTNPSGYGAPNFDDADVVLAVIKVTPYGFTTGYTYTLTISANVITDATVTAPDGAVTNIFADLTWDVFPFTSTKPFIITGDHLGFGTDSQIPFGAYDIEYTVTDLNDIAAATSSEELIVCQVCCCVRSAKSDLKVTDCSCQDDKLDRATKADIYLQSAIWAMEFGDVTNAVANLKYANELCEGKCKTC
jgi:hypothetical protein